MDDELPSNVGRTRKESLALGLPRYAAIKPCKHGHSGPRYTLTRNCCACSQANVTAIQKRDRLRYLAAKAKAE